MNVKASSKNTLKIDVLKSLMKNEKNKDIYRVQRAKHSE